LATTNFNNDDKQRVLDATDIVRLIGEHVTLRAKGREYVGLCPFHDDHKPSMCVVPHKQMYHCFSCGAGGNAFGFVRNYHKMGFREALEYLADRAGITLSPWRPPHRSGSIGEPSVEAEAGTTDRSSILGANLTAAGFFRAVLSHSEHGKAARELIARRSIAPDMVEAFGLGAAPDKWDGLSLTIAGKNLDADKFLKAGLLKPRDSGGQYDAFRNRLMFPIHDQIGRVIAFGARRLNEADEPKYLNSADSPVFNKSTTLYGLYQAAQEIRRSRRAIVTEGYMDAIACHQAGIKNVVATLGTALTAGNANILRRLCDTVVLLFDGDQAGQKAADRAVEVFFAVPVDLKIAMLSTATDAKDPDELLKREGGAETLGAVIERAVDPLTLLFERIRATLAGQGVSAQSRIVEEFLNRLVDLGLRPIDREMRYQLIVKRLATITGIEWSAISAILSQRLGAQRRRAAPASEAAAQAPARLGPAEHILGCILCLPSLLLGLEPQDRLLISPESLPPGPPRAVARAIAEMSSRGGSPDLQAVLRVLDDPDAQQAATTMFRAVERLTGAAAQNIAAHLRDCAARARRDVVDAGGPGGGAAEYSPPLDEDGWAPADDHPAPALPLVGSTAEAGSLARILDMQRQLGDNPSAIPKPMTG
jgi:DNA primase